MVPYRNSPQPPAYTPSIPDNGFNTTQPTLPCPYQGSPPPETTIGPAGPSLPHMEISVYVDWDKVDRIDAAIDVFGLGSNGVSLISASFGLVPVSAGAEIVGGTVEGIGLLKSSYDLIQGDPSSMLLQQTTSQGERIAVMIARTERIAPFVGFLGNLASLWINLKPQITIRWVTP